MEGDGEMSDGDVGRMEEGRVGCVGEGEDGDGDAEVGAVTGDEPALAAEKDGARKEQQRGWGAGANGCDGGGGGGSKSRGDRGDCRGHRVAGIGIDGRPPIPRAIGIAQRFPPNANTTPPHQSLPLLPHISTPASGRGGRAAQTQAGQVL